MSIYYYSSLTTAQVCSLHFWDFLRFPKILGDFPTAPTTLTALTTVPLFRLVPLRDCRNCRVSESGAISPLPVRLTPLKQMLNILFDKSNIFTPFILTTFCKTKYYYSQKQLSPHSLLKFFHTHTCIVFFFFVLLCDL